MKPNREVISLSKKFGVRVKSMIKIQGGVYKITTVLGKQYCLKRMAYPLSRIRWIDLTLHRLQNKGFRRIIWRNRKVPTGKRLYVRRDDGTPFVLHPWFHGKWPSPKNKAHMKACGKMTAKFHQLGSTLSIPRRGIHNQIGSWTNEFLEQQKLLRTITLKAKQHRFGNSMNRLFQLYGDEVVQMGKTAVSLLRASRYRTVCRQQKAVLCHGDLGPTNFMRTSKGLYLLDFETLCLDLRAYDINRLIFNSCKDFGWDFSIARSILDGYQRISKLTKTDLMMLKARLTFPREMYLLVHSYEKRSTLNKRQIEQEIPTVMKNERRRVKCLKRLDNYMTQHKFNP